MSACRSCGAEILWVGTEAGKAMPLDREPYTGDSPAGLFVIRTDSGKSLALSAPADAFPDEPHYRSHFTTCPQANEWRR